MNRILVISLFLPIFALQVWSQDQAQQSNQTPWHPTVNGDSGSLAFATESQKVDTLSGGVTLASTYDNNALSSPTHPVSNVGYMVMPTLSLVESRARTLFSLNYDPAFLWNERLPERYQADHNLDFDFKYRLTEHLLARIHDRFIDQSTSFNEVNENLSGGNVLTEPNSVITPLASQLSNATNVDLVDQVGEATSVGTSGTFNKLSFNETADSGVPLFNNEAWSGQVFYTHHFSVRHSIGATYSFQKISTFGQISEHVQSQSGLVFYTLTVKPGMTLSLFAGPDRTTTSDQFNEAIGPLQVPVSQTQSMWLVDEGANFAWQGQRTSMRINLIHHVSDGGGLTGAVRVYSGVVGVRRQFSKTWSGDISLNYDENDPLSNYYQNGFSDLGGNVGADKALGERFTIGMRYGRERYGLYGVVGSPSYNSMHNQGWITVSYHFSHALGL